MPKQRKPARSRRRRSGRPPVVPPQVPATPAPAPDEVEEADEATYVAPAAVAPAGPRQAPVRAAQQTERPAHRTVLVDYGYVVRDVRNILILATVVIITIVVLSFFLP